MRGKTEAQNENKTHTRTHTNKRTEKQKQKLKQTTNTAQSALIKVKKMNTSKNKTPMLFICVHKKTVVGSSFKKNLYYYN